MRKPTRHLATTPEGLELVSSSFGRRAGVDSRTSRPHRGSWFPQEPPDWDVKDTQGRELHYRSYAGSVHELPEVSCLYWLHFK